MLKAGEVSKLSFRIDGGRRECNIMGKSALFPAAVLAQLTHVTPPPLLDNHVFLTLDPKSQPSWAGNGYSHGSS